MPYDPSFPATGLELKSAGFRDQFHGMKDLIDAASGVTSATVDSVTTLNPGDPATVSLSVTGTVLHMSLGLPRGGDGATGPQGQPFANAVIDSTSTLNPGENATVSVFFDGTLVRFTFGIPRGNQGEQGIQGPTGEVTNTALATALVTTLNSAAANSSANSNGVGTLDIPFTNDPPTLSDIELLRTKLNELITALRR